jgi:hypothetical protein
MTDKQKRAAIYGALHHQAADLLNAARDIYGDLSDSLRREAVKLIELAREFEDER